MSPSDKANSLAGEGGPGHVDRSLTTLEALAGGPMTVDAIAEVTGAHRRTVGRMLEVMEQRGWVALTTDRSYQLTARVLHVAGQVLAGMDLVSAARPHVAELRDEVGESSHFAVAVDGWAVHVLEEPSRHALAVTSHLGSRVPLHATAVGKAIAAYVPEQMAIAVQRGLEPLSERTIVDPDELELHLAGICKRGVAVDDGEANALMRCVAAPVFNMYGAVVGSIGFSGPSSRVLASQLDSYTETVRSVAQRMSEALGYSSLIAD